MNIGSVALTAVIAIGGPAIPTSSSPATASTRSARITHGVAVVYPTRIWNSTVEGKVWFTVVPAGVAVKASFKGLSAGNHGFHVHEFGDCTAADGSAAGEHFNPSGTPHGARIDAVRHAGDLGNIEAKHDGSATLEWTDPALKLNGPDSVIGRALIIHANPDDFKTQPTGNAGSRLACGVIGVARVDEASRESSNYDLLGPGEKSSGASLPPTR